MEKHDSCGLTFPDNFDSVLKCLLSLRARANRTNGHNSSDFVLDCDLAADDSSHGGSDDDAPVQ